MSDGNSHSYSGPGAVSPRNSDPFAGFNAPSACHPGHHQTRPAPLTDLGALVQELESRIEAVQFSGEDIVSTTLQMNADERSAFRAIATDWETANSRILNIAGAWIPMVDDSGLPLAYLRNENRTGVYHLWIRDIYGEVVFHTTTGEEGLQDSIGNDILATIVTLGAASIVRGMASGIASRVAGAIARGATTATIAAARRLATESGQRTVLLVLRAMRARAIVDSFRRRGVQVVVNIGGEASSQDIMRFGVNQIALNPSVRMGAARRVVPNLVKEPGENIGEVFAQESIDRIVSNRLDASIDVNRIAQGAFRVLRRGGSINMHIYTNNPAFAQQFTQALTRAGFRNVNSVSNSLFTAVKP